MRMLANDFNKIRQSPKLFDYAATFLHLFYSLSSKPFRQDLDNGISHRQGSANVNCCLLAISKLIQLSLFPLQQMLHINLLNYYKFTLSVSLEKAKCNLSITPWSLQPKIYFLQIKSPCSCLQPKNKVIMGTLTYFPYFLCSRQNTFY